MFLCKTTSTSNLQNTTFLLVSHTCLQQLRHWSSTTSAHYVALQKEIWMKTSENMLVWLSKMVFTLHFCMGC
jgi:hypothetical protein